MQLLVGFVVSGIIHGLGEGAVGREFLFSSFIFYLLQPLGITLEDWVISACTSTWPELQNARWVRPVGWLWTFVWFSWSRVYFIDWSLRAGMGRQNLLKFSVVEKLLPLVGIEVP